MTAPPGFAMPTVPDDDQIERLAQLLEQRAVPFRGFDMEALDGYLSALVLSPEPVPFEEWQAPIWGLPPRWDDDERAQVDAMLRDQMHLVALRVRCDADPWPVQFTPPVQVPTPADVERLGLEEDTLPIGGLWATGFFRGVALREAAWDAWLDANDGVEQIFILLDQLASGDVLDDDVLLAGITSGHPDVPGTPITFRQRLDIIASLPAMLTDLQHYRIHALTPREPLRRAPTPQRNDSCPCGSGCKYKKCCGA